MKPETYLSKACPVLRKIIEVTGPLQIAQHPRRQPYESLIRAVAHQQLHGKAAETILNRFRALYTDSSKFPSAERILETPMSSLREVGFSEAKSRALHDIAARAIDGTIPSSRVLVRLSDEEIVERLTQARGVGRWTVEMLLIFQLGRPDVLPVDDFGVRNGFRIARRLKEMPTPKALASYGERWAPHRSAAAWYLWRAADTKERTRPRPPRPRRRKGRAPKRTKPPPLQERDGGSM